MTNSIKSKINAKISETKPRSKSYFTSINILKVGIFVSCLIIASFLISTFFWDIYLKFKIITDLDVVKMADISDWRVLRFILTYSRFEALLAAGLFGLFSYLVYESTDWPMVKQRLWILVSISLLSVFIASGYAVWSEYDERPRRVIETMNNTTRPMPQNKFRDGAIDKKKEEWKKEHPEKLDKFKDKLEPHKTPLLDTLEDRKTPLLDAIRNGGLQEA